MTIDPSYPFERLQELSGASQQKAVIRWLNSRGIRWTTDGKGNPCTTLTQIDNALEREEQEFHFDGQETQAG